MDINNIKQILLFDIVFLPIFNTSDYYTLFNPFRQQGGDSYKYTFSAEFAKEHRRRTSLLGMSNMT